VIKGPSHAAGELGRSVKGRRMKRAMQLAPIVFALAGAGFGLCVRMLAHNDASYQIHLEESVPLVFGSGFVGALIGCGIKGACNHRPNLVRRAGLASVALLGAALMAPLGWIAGTMVATERLPHAHEKEDVQHLPPLGMAVGAGVGCVLGLAVGGIQVLLDRGKRSAEQSAPANQPCE
jgi:hypothetical protein